MAIIDAYFIAVGVDDIRIVGSIKGDAIRIVLAGHEDLFAIEYFSPRREAGVVGPDFASIYRHVDGGRHCCRCENHGCYCQISD